MQRRHFLAGSAALGLAAPAVRAAGDPKLLKFVPQADIALLDPHFASALVTRNYAYVVYDTLYGVDDAARLCREIQQQAFRDVPYIPLGAFFFAAAYRSNLSGFLKGGIPLFTNVRRT